jgi:hypothetical protein
MSDNIEKNVNPSSSAIGLKEDISNVLEFWTSFDINNKRTQLERQCVEMRESKTASISTKKALNEVTKSFRYVMTHSITVTIHCRY